MNGFDIATERIAATASRVDDIGAALGREIATMHDLLAQITSSWQSSAAAPRFAAAMQEYLTEAGQLKEALVGHGAGLLATGRSFDAAESTVAEALPAVAG